MDSIFKSVVSVTPQGMAANAITTIVAVIFIVIALILLLFGQYKVGIVMGVIGAGVYAANYMILK